MIQLEVQAQIANDIETYANQILERLCRTEIWELRLNPNYNPSIGESRIAVFNRNNLSIVIYINLKGRLAVEPVIEMEHPAMFGMGFRVSTPYQVEWDKPAKGIVIAIKRRLPKWRVDVADFLERQVQQKIDRATITQQKVSFARQIGMTIEESDLSDRMIIPNIGEVYFTTSGVKLGKTFTPIDWKTAAQAVAIIATAITDK
ncbi:hypothetical protein [Chamaesiphon sp.]|uniref:hypothetical protein n=1 Tax=Chamaesiphon sp. TaxID=2814140 RepID=UPI0035931417